MVHIYTYIHNVILFSHKKDHLWVISNEVNETRAYYTKWNKSERENKYFILTHGITNSMDMSLGKLQVFVMDRETWHAAIHGVAKSRTRLSGWTELNAPIGLISVKWHFLIMCAVLSCSVVSDSVTPWTVIHQALLSIWILQTSMLEWVAMSSSRRFSQPRSPTLQADSLPSEPPRWCFKK